MPDFGSNISGRSDLARFLTRAMESSYEAFESRKRADQERNLLKSYIIEVHIDGSEDPFGSGSDLLAKIARQFDGSLDVTDDPSLLIMALPKQSAVFYVDQLNPRFWSFHTLSKSEHADKLVTALIKTSPLMDRAWFPSRILEDASRLGRFEGFGIKFDSTIYQLDERNSLSETDESEWSPLNSRLISLSLKTPWGARSQLRKLRSAGVFPYASALSWVRVRAPKDMSDGFVLEDITYYGKFTARGSSFTDHQHLLATVRDRYEASIKRLEQSAAIGASREKYGLRISGEPLVLAFPKPLRNLDEIIPRMFTSAEPYRFWGIPRLANRRLIRVHAVDLHVGQNLTLEITPECIVAYLPQGTCGNTVTRLISNVQHTLDPTVTIKGEENWLGQNPATLQ